MSEKRFYVPPEAIRGGLARIEGEQAHHLVSVLRRKPGDDIVLFDGEGTECFARIERIGRDFVVARITAKEVHKTTDRPTVGLYVAMPKGKKFDLIVEQATELSADSITPLVTARTVVRLDEHGIPTKLERWRRITVAAAKQSRRATLPQVNPPIDFSSIALDVRESAFSILAWSHGEAVPVLEALSHVSPSHTEIRIVVGPEGGFTLEETETARKSGMFLVSLGENILRTETAAIAALAAVSQFLDRQRGGSASSAEHGG
jgi:16S rRNA (uracil1498-N3)-methyltransferase